MNLNNTLRQIAVSNEHITSVLLASCLACFMTIKGWTNICFTLILIIAITQFNSYALDMKRQMTNLHFKALLIALSLPVFALLVTQTIRHDWVMKSYDSPIRMLFGVLLLFYFSSRKICMTDIIGFASPLCLIVTAVAIYLHPDYTLKWGGRYATSFVDPNSFGAYAVIFTSFCLFNLTHPFKKYALWTAYQLLGIIVGIDLIIGSGTRGSWLAIPFILLFWLISNRQHINARSILLGFTILAIFPLLALTIFPNAGTRFYGIYSEVYSWSHHAKVETSAGIRLTMWKMTWVLFQHNPWYGYGDIGVRRFLSEPWLASAASPEGLQTIACCGPHNELLANIVRSGLIGGLAVIGLLIYPICFAAKYLQHSNERVALASQLLIAYLLIEIICSVSMEVFTLKYTASFYSLLITALIGQILFTIQPKSTHA